MVKDEINKAQGMLLVTGPSGDGSPVGLRMPVNGDLTLDGNVYVSGDIVLINNGTLRIDESVSPGVALVFIA